MVFSFLRASKLSSLWLENSHYSQDFIFFILSAVEIHRFGVKSHIKAVGITLLSGHHTANLPPMVRYL